MKILVINSGSSSIKFQLINMKSSEVLIKGLAERIGIDHSRLKYSVGERKEVVEQSIPNHRDGISLIVKTITETEKVIQNKSEIFAVGHRVVHAGEKYNGTVVIDDDVLGALKECIPLAPLHNPPNIVGIEAAQETLPGVPMAGTFDTAFHQTMPPRSYLYPIPCELYEKYKIRRYGFHGTSHYFVAREGARRSGKNLDELKIITCHLGNGSSMAAVDRGKSIDTSMGFTPLEGLMMGTRCGSIDPAIPMFLQQRENLSPREVDTLLNKKSGILGISGISSDMRDIEIKSGEGDERAILTLEMFTYRIKKYIGAYMAAMNGVDLIIFTGGIGERDRGVRKHTLSKMENLGIRLDPRANQETFGEFGVITTEDSSVTAMVVPTNEELEIAMQTRSVIEQHLKNRSN